MVWDRGEFMLCTKTRWNFLEESESTTRSIEDISFDVTPITLDLLYQRGITEEAEINTFLSPELENLNDEKDLHMIDFAAHRVHHAIQNAEKILVFGDYDADGVCSTTLMLETLQELGAQCDFYIPNRFTEGYGPNETAFREAAANG